MIYSQLRDHFNQILNRDDCSDTLSDLFISMGVRRVERLLRTPLQKYIKTWVIPSDFTGSLSVPNDYIGMVELRVDDTSVPRIVGHQTELKTGFEFLNGQLKFNFTIDEGSIVTLEYYAEFDKDVGPNDYTTWSLTISDLAIYAALVFAADYFMDVRKPDFQSTMVSLTTEVQDMADVDAMSGGGMSITPYGGGVA
jgi:hypothetical protein